jgi:ribosome recycling factor
MIEDYRQKAQGLLSHFQDELRQIRTGRAQSSLVEGLMVEVTAYGGAHMKLQELASISTPDASLIVIQPFDPSVIKDIEKAFHTSQLGLMPVTDQNQIRLAIPALTAERRQQLTKLVAQKAEEARIAVRNLRTQIKDDIEAQKEQGGVSEDDIKRQLDELQKEVDKTNASVERLKEEKEKDLLTV